MTEPLISGEERFSTLAERTYTVLGARPRYTLAEFAAKAGVEVTQAAQFWRLLGLPQPDPDEVAFTENDVRALVDITESSSFGVMSEQTAQSVLRAMAHTGERLAWWQVEAMVDDVARRHDLDDRSARMVVLDHIAEVADIFQEEAIYAWRRHMAAIIKRFVHETATPPTKNEDSGQTLPMTRAVGFADLVRFTQLSAGLGPEELGDLIQDFESTVRDVVALEGGRVIKTLGDAVMFVADEPTRGAHIAVQLAEAIGADGRTPHARVGMVWGRVLARFGDIFGPPVNLASRLTAQADPGTVLTDAETAKALKDEPLFSLIALPVRDVRGIGMMAPVRVDPTYAEYAAPGLV